MIKNKLCMFNNMLNIQIYSIEPKLKSKKKKDDNPRFVLKISRCNS